MTYLSETEIVELDEEIDRRIETFSLLSRDRDTALFSLLITFEDWVDGLGTESDLAKRKNAYHAAYDSLNFCIQWINNHCPRTITTGDLATTEEILFEAWSMFNEGMTYSKVWTQISLLRRGRAQAERVGEASFRLSPISLRDKNRDSGRMLLASGSDPDTPAETELLSFTTRQNIWDKIRKLKRKNQLTYSIQNKVLDGVQRAIARRSILEWHMDPSWNLGGYTFGDLRKFWTSLQAVQAVHDIAVQGATQLDLGKIPYADRFSWKIMRRTNREWVTKMSNRSGLSFSKTQQIISDLTYEEALYGPGKQDPHVMYTPFFAFESGLVGLSGKIVQISNIERNIWSNVHRRRQNIVDRLKEEKEAFWIGEISQKLEATGFECVHRIGFTFERVPRNLDLLILSRGERFGLICELKWITGSDEVKAVVSMDKDIAYAAEQALISEQWLAENLERTSRESGIEIAALKQYSFKPLVLTKEGLPSGFIEAPPVPVVTENLLKWMLIDPHQLGLRGLWDFADSMKYLPTEGVHFRNISPEIKWGNLSFELHNLAFEGLRRWRPAEDIKQT